ncbi:DNA fragmentation factor-related protein 4 [Augochlora pura]
MSLIAGCFRRLTETPAKVSELKGYKVTDVSRTRKFGVACRSLQELKRKACAKLNVTNDLAEVNVFLLDGSQIDEEYFSILDAQTTLIVQKPGEKVLSGVDVVNEAYMHRRCQDRIRGYLYKTIEQIKSSETFANDHRARKQLLYAIAFFKMQLKQDHYFGHYFDRTRAAIEPGDSVDERDSATCYDHCPCRLNELENSAYFRLFGTTSCVDGAAKKKAKLNSRSEEEEEEVAEEDCPYTVRTKERQPCVAMCDRKGEFRCSGVWNADSCSYGDRHKINPYRSREELILFSTWNFDHKIERSRTLVPQLLKLLSQGVAKEEDILELYDNLFTAKNLRLVHIVCHDKGAHK